MRAVLFAIAILTPFHAACSKDKDASPTTDPAPAPEKVGAPAPSAGTSAEPTTGTPSAGGEAAKETGAHGHATGHGGQVATTAGGHMELVARPNGEFHLWLLDQKQQPRPIDGASATVKLGVKGYAPVALAPKEDHLAGQGARISATHADADVTVEVGGKTETARFKLDFEDHGGGKGGGHGN